MGTLLLTTNFIFPGGSSGLKPFSIDDAFDIPEDDDDLDYASDKANSNIKAKAPIIRNGQVGKSFFSSPSIACNYPPKNIS